MINHGTRPERLRRKDRDYIRSFHPEVFAGTAKYPEFPNEYLTDTTGWLPDQNADGNGFACTSYSTAKLARILGIVDAQFIQIENITNSNNLKGYGVLASIDMARRFLRWFQWRYTIQTTGMLDYFDAFRLAQVSGIPERRAISCGTPWFSSWERAVQMGQKIMPMPTPEELAQAHQNPNSLSWHNYILDGWSDAFPVAPGQLLYRADSWQGTLDYLYFPREVINTVQNLYGTIAVTGTNMSSPNVFTVTLPDWWKSLWHSWLGFSY